MASISNTKSFTKHDDFHIYWAIGALNETLAPSNNKYNFNKGL